jgi:hypothetical protein
MHSLVGTRLNIPNKSGELDVNVHDSAYYFAHCNEALGLLGSMPSWQYLELEIILFTSLREVLRLVAQN